MKAKHKEELEKVIKDIELKYNKTNLPTPSNSTENKNTTTKNGADKEFCKISGYDEVDNDVKKDITKELLNSIKMYSNIYEKIDNKYDINDIVDWLIKNRHIKYHEQKYRNRYRVINKYKRSFELYTKFQENLQYVYFSFSKMTRISDKLWDEWLNKLSDKIKYYATKNGADEKINETDNSNDEVSSEHNEINQQSYSTTNNEDTSKDNINNNVKIDESRKYKVINRPIRTINTNKYFNEIDFTKYKIGDKIIYKNKMGNDNDILIQNWCKMCIKTPCKYSHDYCKDCNKAKNGGGFYIYNGNKNICQNCRNLFEKNYIDDLYCKECIIDGCNNYVPVSGIKCKSH